MPHPTLSEIRPDDVRVTLTRAGWELIPDADFPQAKAEDPS